MRIAAAQIACSPGDVKANLRKIRDFSAAAKEAGADLVVFPEMADTGYTMAAMQAHAGAWSSGAVPELQDIAKSLSLVIVCGVSERDDHIYNTQAVIDADGNIAAKYRKTHLFTAPPLGEDKCFFPGNTFTAFDLGELRFGLSICYDLRFPEVYRKQAVENEVNAFIISSAWPFPRIEHLRTLALARAIENQSYTILANRVGTDDGVTFCGSSAIIDPYGVLIAAASPHREELVHAEISLEAVAQVRDRMHVFAERRRDLYE
jgi:omega-amidase